MLVYEEHSTSTGSKKTEFHKCCLLYNIHDTQLWNHLLRTSTHVSNNKDHLSWLTAKEFDTAILHKLYAVSWDEPQSWLVILQKSRLTKLLTISHSDKPYVCRAPMYILPTSKGYPTTKGSPWKPLCSVTVVHINSYTVVTTTGWLR